jgi:GntR family transcriptional regulator, transcriptional repressor for pyruvate dehydrogenase complex
MQYLAYSLSVAQAIAALAGRHPAKARGHDWLCILSCGIVGGYATSIIREHYMRAKAGEAKVQELAAVKAVPRKSEGREMNPISLQKIPKTGELIAGELRKQIVRGELAEGASLPAEADLMAQLSVSRASLREALRVLESESLLTVRRGSRGGPVVHRPDPNLAAKYFGLVLQSDGTTLDDVLVARLLIEPPALRVVIENTKGETLDGLRQIVAEEDAAFKRRDLPEMGRCVARFHGALMELTGNKTIILIMKMLNIIYVSHIAAIQETAKNSDPTEAGKTSVRSHNRIIDLIERGATEEAVKHWYSHLLKVRDYMLNAGAVHKVIDVV